jgi:very-short-patch-repair endonuclease
MAPPRKQRLKRSCLVCNKEFEFLQRSDKAGRKFCGNACKFSYQKKNPPRNRTGFNKCCIQCGKVFYAQLHQKHYKYCSANCASRGKVGIELGGKKKRHNLSFTCKECYVVVKNQQQNRINRAKFCSYSCRAVFYTRNSTKSTVPEQTFERLLNENNIMYQRQYKLENKLYDFYIPSANTLIEIDGIFWHAKKFYDGSLSHNKLYPTQQKVLRNDVIKNQLAKKHGHTLIRVWEDEILTFDMSVLL